MRRRIALDTADLKSTAELFQTVAESPNTAPKLPRRAGVVAHGPVQILVADPPWQFDDKLGKRGAEYHYNTMPVDQIARFPIPPVADQAMLFMWRVAGMQEEAIFVMRAWGFRPYTEIPWIKVTKNGKLGFALGYVTRGAHETCLVGVRGKRIPPATFSRRSVIFGRLGEHSEKPEDFYQLVEELYPSQRKCELFARRTRPGWTQHGDQLGVLDAVPRNPVVDQESITDILWKAIGT